MTTDLTEAKAALRKAAYAARKSAHAGDADGRARAAADHLLTAMHSFGALRTEVIVAGYRPIRTEISPDPALERLAEEGIPLAMPVVEGAGRPLSFRPWSPGAAEIEGAFGARIPADETPVTPTALIVPLVAFDGDRWRLGYGGGFYDRTLAMLRADNPDLVAIGLAYAMQQVEAVPREATDRQLDAIATERGVLRRGVEIGHGA
ncbi:MAG: 5-formyltetrahydrofolate cyclo-ligase [Pseudomonadota bacterium]